MGRAQGHRDTSRRCARAPSLSGKQDKWCVGKAREARGGENSNGHPGGWPSIIHREADVATCVPLPLSPDYQRDRLITGRGSRGFASLTFKARPAS